MTTFDLSPSEAGGVHAWLGGSSHEVDSLIARTRAAAKDGSVEWRVPVTAATVHRLSSIHGLARDEGVRMTLLPASGLDGRDQAFLADYQLLAMRPPRSRPGQSISLIHEVLAGALEACDTAVRVLSPPAKREAAGATPKSAVIIGAYGGDHIGDAAILGGVLLKLHAELGIETAHVMSHRPEHTRRLAAGLSTPVAVKVWRYTTKAADRLLRKASALVIAGGPVMDLPRVLAKHLAVAETAHGLGVPFYIDRVGVGPFRRKLSRWAARRLLEKADRISLRTAGSAKDPAMAGLAYDLHPDPAFEYLKTRAELDRLAPAAVEAVDRLLAGTQGRTLIGLNVRPIEHWWLPDGQDYSRAAEVHFLEQLAEGMVRLSEAAGGEVTFVFFPMNSIQFAMSDLPTGYDLHKLVGDRADLRVWEADPDVDDMLHLLRRLDGALTMRFHASIFALAQGLPTYGVDYYPGQGGKVAELFTDLGREADVRVMDAFDAGWFVEKFSQHLSPRG